MHVFLKAIKMSLNPKVIKLHAHMHTHTHTEAEVLISWKSGIFLRHSDFIFFCREHKKCSALTSCICYSGTKNKIVQFVKEARDPQKNAVPGGEKLKDNKSKPITLGAICCIPKA